MPFLAADAQGENAWIRWLVWLRCVAMLGVLAVVAAVVPVLGLIPFLTAVTSRFGAGDLRLEVQNIPAAAQGVLILASRRWRRAVRLNADRASITEVSVKVPTGEKRAGDTLISLPISAAEDVHLALGGQQRS